MILMNLWTLCAILLLMFLKLCECIIWTPRADSLYEYYIGLSLYNFQDAMEFCRSESGELTTIENEAEQLWLADKFLPEPNCPNEMIFLLGLKWLDNTTWKWIDGRSVNFAYWRHNELLHNTGLTVGVMESSCNATDDQYKWTAVGDTDVGHPLCKKERTDISSTVPSLPTDVAQSDNQTDEVTSDYDDDNYYGKEDGDDDEEYYSRDDDDDDDNDDDYDDDDDDIYKWDNGGSTTGKYDESGDSTDGDDGYEGWYAPNNDRASDSSGSSVWDVDFSSSSTVALLVMLALILSTVVVVGVIMCRQEPQEEEDYPAVPLPPPPLPPQQEQKKDAQSSGSSDSDNGNDFSNSDDYWSKNPHLDGFHYQLDLSAPLNPQEEEQMGIFWDARGGGGGAGGGGGGHDAAKAPMFLPSGGKQEHAAHEGYRKNRGTSRNNIRNGRDK